MSFALGGFNDLWLYGDPDYDTRHRVRDTGASIVASFACPVCGAQAGVPCSRPTVIGRSVTRGLPHFGRGSGSAPHNRSRVLTGESA